jgi:hypothetical protein
LSYARAAAWPPLGSVPSRGAIRGCPGPPGRRLPEQEVAGSNPAIPTVIAGQRPSLGALRCFHRSFDRHLTVDLNTG